MSARRRVVSATAAESGALAAGRVVEVLAGASDERGSGVLGVATGSSPRPLYAALSALVDAGSVDLAGVLAFALDEYVGLEPAHPESYHSIVARDIVGPLRMDPALVRVPDGMAADVDAQAAAYDRAIASCGGVDVQILGIGANGHIGFNEPGSAFDSRTRRVTLTESTRRANSRFFASLDEVPTEAVSQGLATIMSARSIVLVASGAAKARAVRDALLGPVTPECPASLLQEHVDVTYFLDAEAAALLV